jgi:AcrR family transcriptional regulator
MALKRVSTPRQKIALSKQSYVREEILNSAVQLFAERSYRAVTIDDIAANLGYSKSVVYYYFKSKNGILWQIFSRVFDSYFGAIDAIRSEGLSPDLTLARMVRRHALNVMENREWTAIYFREQTELDAPQQLELGRMKREYDFLFEQVFVAGVAKGMFRPIAPQVAISGLLGMCNWLYVWYSATGPLAPQEIADQYVALLADGYMS